MTEGTQPQSPAKQALGAPSPGAQMAGLLGVVVIGRNEGERLRRCLASLAGRAAHVVYVDSGSTDGSVAAAAALGAVTRCLDRTQPFTAARARNEGTGCLAALSPAVEYIQFVDGDCEVAPGWLEAAVAFLAGRPEVAAVSGRRRERFPERSVYNLLCDMEWNTPIGPARACGGDVAMRASALVQAGGYRADLIAGEEPELCIRLRAAGWLIWRFDAEMTLHDAAITRFGQWWKRSMRAGFAYAQGANLHGAPPERHWVRESRSAWLWGLALPLVLMIMATIWGRWMMAGFAVYLLQAARIYAKTPGRPRARLAYAAYLVMGKFAEAAGQLRFWRHQLARTQGRLIEYK